MTRARDTADTQDNSGGAVAPFVAGKNKIINGDFGVWQRDTTFSPPGAGSYTADRWRTFYVAAVPTTYVVSRQTFTPGSEPVSGYNSPYFWRGVLTTVGSATEVGVQQRIENVGTFANTTVTISFYAKSDSNRTQTVNFQQNFGSGGSSTVGLTAQTINTTASWQRFSLQFAIPSISGKTIGANSYIQATISQNLTNGNTLDIWGWQVEAGSVATAFETASGSIGGELALCQRYYWRFAIELGDTPYCISRNWSSSAARGTVFFPITMRNTPTFGSSVASKFSVWTNSDYAGTSIASVGLNKNNASFQLAVSGTPLTANNATAILSSPSVTDSYLEYIAEL